MPSLLLSAGVSILVALLAVIWANTSSSISEHSANTNSSDVPAAGAWYIHHAAWLASNAAAVSDMHASLQAARAAASSNTTLQFTAAALNSSSLPKRVKLQQAQQLLINKQLLAHSLANQGFAAARVTALRQHYSLQLDPAVAGDASAAAQHAGDTQPQQQQQGSPGPGASSRGILIVGGSRTHLGNAYILLRMLRQHLHCQLPVEVVYYGHQVGRGPMACNQPVV